MPLTMAAAGEMNSIKRVGGLGDVKRFLGSLGFVEGEDVIVISRSCGNVIVNIKESRVAISEEMANKIIV